MRQRCVIGRCGMTSETLQPGRDLLLFFGEIEAAPGTLGERFRHAVRPTYQRVLRRQRTTGFHVAYRNLVRSLVDAGYTVHENRRDLALSNPSYPVGLAGYPRAVADFDLPNPTVLGPGMFDHPALAPHLMEDQRFRKYIVPCQWMMDLFAPTYGKERCTMWFAGIDVAHWPSLKDRPKDIDFVIYDKIRWAREHYVPAVLDPILATLTAAGCKYEILRYAKHDQAAYRAALSRSKAMIFVCEHETQGLAYQEALASDVAVLAWDNGFWLDPLREKYTMAPVPASSVPFFGPTCGDRFVDAAAFPEAFERFRRDAAAGYYRPRDFVVRELAFTDSARRYAETYFALL